MRRRTSERHQPAVSFAADSASTGKARQRKPETRHMYNVLYTAIANRRLPPGTKLSEERLCRVFGVSRTRLREVFFRLAQERIIVLKQNQGAFVASPTTEETSDVFAARKAIEVGILRTLIERASDADIQILMNHLSEEKHAREAGDRERLTQLTGDFHLLLAERTGNLLFMDITRRLVALSSLTISLYDSPNAQACKQEEHILIVEAIREKNSAWAEQLLIEHLEHVEQSLNLREEESNHVDFETVLLDLLSIENGYPKSDPG